VSVRPSSCEPWNCSIATEAASLAVKRTVPQPWCVCACLCLCVWQTCQQPTRAGRDAVCVCIFVCLWHSPRRNSTGAQHPEHQPRARARRTRARTLLRPSGESITSARSTSPHSASSSPSSLLV
jgi:hypothetical protein